MEELIWVKIETNKGNDDVWSFKGQVIKSIFESIVSGQLTSGFFKMQQVYWIVHNYNDEGTKQGKELYQYGRGELKAYRGEMYSRIDHLVTIAPIDGEMELAQYDKEKGKHLSIVSDIRS